MRCGRNEKKVEEDRFCGCCCWHFIDVFTFLIFFWIGIFMTLKLIFYSFITEIILRIYHIYIVCYILSIIWNDNNLYDKLPYDIIEFFIENKTKKLIEMKSLQNIPTNILKKNECKNFVFYTFVEIISLCPITLKFSLSETSTCNRSNQIKRSSFKLQTSGTFFWMWLYPSACWFSFLLKLYRAETEIK